MRDTKGKTKEDTRKLRAAIVSEVPIEIIRAISEAVTASSRVSERVKDFS